MRKKMIIFVLPQLKTGGGIRVIVELSNILSQKYDVRFVLPNSQSDCSFDISEDIKIEKVGNLPKKGVDKIVNIIKMFLYLNKHYKDEIVITTDPIQSAMFIPLKFNRLFRYVQADDYRIFDDLLLLKNKFFLLIYKFVTKLSYKKDINYLFNSTFSYKQFVELKGKSVAKNIVHPSINHNVFRFLAYPKDKNRVKICLIARKHPMKRFDDFITVYNEIKMIPHVKEKIADISIISHDDLSSFDIKDFTMVVPQDDNQIVEVLNRSDIYIFTSLWEGFGLPPLEAMSCGCAVIASDAKGIDEYARDGENLLKYPPMDTQALKDRLLRLIEDSTLREDLQKNALLSAKEFSWTKSAKMLEKYLFKGLDE